jgi:hypothetical protein
LEERDTERVLTELLQKLPANLTDSAGWTIGSLLEAALGAANPKGGARGEAVLGFINTSKAVAPKKLREVAGSQLRAILNAVEKMTLGSLDDSELYGDALNEVQTRARRDLSRAIEKASDPADTDATGRIADLNSQMSFQMDYVSLSGPEKAAIRCADILGRWLADAIALVWELHRPNEIRLAGGPLSGKTGIFVALSARKALEAAYAFDVELHRPSLVQGSATAPIGGGVAPVHGVREIRKLILVFPSEDSGEGGPKGAALAAFSRHLADMKMRQLQVCRSPIASREIGADNNMFTADEVDQRAKTKPDVESPWLVTPEDVSEMLTLESAGLRLTRQTRQALYGAVIGLLKRGCPSVVLCALVLPDFFATNC